MALRRVVVAQLPKRWVIATMGVTTAVVSISAMVPIWAGSPTEAMIIAAMGATDAAGPTAAMPTKAEEKHTVSRLPIPNGWPYAWEI